MSKGIRVNKPIAIVGGLLSLAVVGLLAVGFRFDPKALDQTVMHGKSAPAFALTGVDGEPVTLDDLRGRPVVINFWSTWCIPCKQEHPVLLDGAKLYPEVTFLGVVYQDEKAPIQRYLKRYGQGYDHLMDPGSRVAMAYGVGGVPETFFIDAQGVVTYKTAGVVTENTLAEQLEPLVRGAQ